MKAWIAGALLALGGCSADPGGYPPAMGVKAQDEALGALCEAASERWLGATGIALACDSGRPLMWASEPFRNPCAAAATNGERVAIQSHYQPTCSGNYAMANPAYPGPGALEVNVLHELGHVLRGSGGHAPSGAMQGGGGNGLLDSGTLEWLCQTAPCQWFRPE